MKIRNVTHRGLRRFIDRDDASGLDPAVIEKLRNMITFLQEMEHPRELHGLPHWKAHVLTGDRRGTWSLSVSKNWRITFQLDEGTDEICDLDFEDYH